MYLQRVLDGHTRSRCGLYGEKSLWDPAGSFEVDPIRWTT